MGYPTSVFAPSARSNGQVIDASHVNDLQTEVAAVESGLLGTITHSLNVSGASTLATLQCAGSTFSVRPVMPPPEIAKVYLESTVALGSSGASTVAWTAADFKTNSSMHSTGTNPERLIPQSTGVYRLTANITLSSNSTGTRDVRFVDSSNGIFGRALAVASSVEVLLPLVAYKRFDVVGGYVVCVLTLSGASTISLSSGIAGTWLTMEKL